MEKKNQKSVFFMQGEWLENELSENEEVIFGTRTHTYGILSSLLLLLLGLINLWFLFAGFGYLFFAVGRYFYYEYVITNHRVIIKKGLIYIRTESIPIPLIEDVLIRRSLSDNIIRGGMIFIFGSAIKSRKLNGLGNPTTFRNALYSQLPATTFAYFERA